MSTETATPCHQSFDDGQDAAQFFVLGGAFGARTGRFTTDVDDVSSFDNEVASVADGHLRIGPHASVRERVRSDVDDPHDEGAGGMRVGSRADIDHAVESRTASQALIEVCGESLTCTPH